MGPKIVCFNWELHMELSNIRQASYCQSKKATRFCPFKSKANHGDHAFQSWVGPEKLCFNAETTGLCLIRPIVRYVYDCPVELGLR